MVVIKVIFAIRVSAMNPSVFTTVAPFIAHQRIEKALSIVRRFASSFIFNSSRNRVLGINLSEKIERDPQRRPRKGLAAGRGNPIDSTCRGRGKKDSGVTRAAAAALCVPRVFRPETCTHPRNSIAAQE